jgi:hypothetical protein
MMRAWRWILLAVTAFAAIASAFLPVWIIQPFRPQSPRGVQFALTLRSLAPLLTMAMLVIAAALIYTLWRGSRWWSKGFAILALLLTTFGSWFARQNHFEWMFHPLPNPRYASASAASFVKDSDLVLAVERNGDAAAYPIRQLGYHHIVQDVVGRVPIVVTY